MSDMLEAALQYGAACKRLVNCKLENANEQITAALFDEITSLRAESERLREYAEHKQNCASCATWYADKQPDCDCGYDALMAEVEEGK